MVKKTNQEGSSIPFRNRISRILLPKFFRGWIFKFMIDSIRHDRLRPEPGVEIYELSKEHIENLVILPTRRDLLEKMQKGSICAELGVNEAEFSKEIIEIVSPDKLHLIDLWGSERYDEKVMEDALKRVKEEIESGQAEVHRGYSYDVLEEFPEASLDWVYIDTDHTYSTTIKEIEVASRKVKPNGIIAGHDYIEGTWNNWIRYGVMEAVNEFCVKNDWEMIYRTTEITTPPSFAIRKKN